MPPTKDQIAANNRRKIEKHRRKLAYHDLQVQGTNNSSIMSKRSVEAIYNPVLDPKQKEWIKYFVPKLKRRSPAINRGYWIRMESIKEMVLKIKEKYAASGLPVRVVNLGCGFDTLPFQLLANGPERLEFYDFDYPELVKRKLSVIESSDEILEVIGKSDELSSKHTELGIELATKYYKLVGCDLKDTLRYQKQLELLLKGDKGAPTLFIAEVSLAYMKPQDANPVIEISSKLRNSHVLVLEQIMPSGPKHFFAEKMLHHFNHLRSPLQCVETYSTKDKQRCRFKQYFPQVEINDLFECWREIIHPERKKLVDKVEVFDEWEEFIVFCQHYVVIHATNSNNLFFRDKNVTNVETSYSEKVSVVHRGCEDLELKFPAACEVNHQDILIHGGMWQTRIDELLHIETDTFNKRLVALSEKRPSPRMCHTLTNAENGCFVVCGGRGRPGLVFDDVWIYECSSNSWTSLGSLPVPMYRHSAVCISPGVVLVFGEGQFVKISIENNAVFLLEAIGSVPSLQSCAFVYEASCGTGYIVGGMSDKTEPRINCEVYRFQITENTVTVELVVQATQLARIGCVGMLQNDTLVIAGGAGSQLHSQTTTVMAVDTRLWKIDNVCIDEKTWEKGPVFIGSAVAGNVIVGGGAVCYSFGSAYNSAFEVRFH